MRHPKVSAILAAGLIASTMTIGPPALAATHTNSITISGTIKGGGPAMVQILAEPRESVGAKMKPGDIMHVGIMTTVRTNSDGSYTVQIPRSALAKYANPNGIVNMLARSMTGNMTRTYGFWVRTTRQGRYHATKAVGASFRMIRSAAPMPSVSAWLAGTRAAIPDICVIGQTTIDAPAWTAVGETSDRLSGTDSMQQFDYKKTESSSLGIGFSASGDVGTFSASGTHSQSSRRRYRSPSSRTTSVAVTSPSSSGSNSMKGPAACSRRCSSTLEEARIRARARRPQPTAPLIRQEAHRSSTRPTRLLSRLRLRSPKSASARRGRPAGTLTARSNTSWDHLAIKCAARTTSQAETPRCLILASQGKRIAGRVAVAAAVALLAACSPSVNTGPLGDGGTGGGICIPVPHGQVESWGITALENRGTSSVTIEKVTIVGAKHLQLAAAYVVPITGKVDYGSWPGYPPPPRDQKGVEWDRHAAADGARVAPMVGGRHADLVAVLKPTARVARIMAINVLYKEGGTEYQMQTHYPILLLTGGVKACAGDWSTKYHIKV